MRRIAGRRNASPRLIRIALENAVVTGVVALAELRHARRAAGGGAGVGLQGVLDRDFATTLAAMARVRNRLVHLYWNVDDGQVQEYLQTSLDDIDRFARTIAAYAW